MGTALVIATLFGYAVAQAPVCPARPAPVPMPSPPPALLEAASAWSASLCAAAVAAGVPSVQFHAAYRGAETPLVAGACGLASREPAANATRATLYRIASVSKLFPALLLAQLADAHAVVADAPYARYVPEFRVYDPWEGSNGSTITLRHLASHMGGLGRTTPPAVATLADALAAVAGQAGGMTAPAGLAPHYSNFGFDLLGHALAERILNSSYSAAVAARVITPLGLQGGTGFNFSLDVMTRLATGYTDDGIIPVPFAPSGFMEPEGGAYSTAENLTSLVDAIAAVASGGGGAAATALGLSPAAARDLLRPLWISADGTFQQGAPWEMFQLPAGSTAGVLVRGKDGGLTGYTSYVGVVPELRLSVAMLWNADSVGAIPAAYAFASLVPPLIDALVALQPGPSPGEVPMDFVGTYASVTNVLHSGVVSFANGTLVFDSFLTGRAPLAAVSGLADVFMLFSDPGVPGQPCAVLFGGAPNAYLAFARNATSGSVSGFSAPFTFADAWIRL